MKPFLVMFSIGAALGFAYMAAKFVTAQQDGGTQQNGSVDTFKPLVQNSNDSTYTRTRTTSEPEYTKTTPKTASGVAFDPTKHRVATFQMW